MHRRQHDVDRRVGGFLYSPLWLAARGRARGAAARRRGAGQPRRGSARARRRSGARPLPDRGAGAARRGGGGLLPLARGLGAADLRELDLPALPRARRRARRGRARAAGWSRRWPGDSRSISRCSRSWCSRRSRRPAPGGGWSRPSSRWRRSPRSASPGAARTPGARSPAPSPGSRSGGSRLTTTRSRCAAAAARFLAEPRAWLAPRAPVDSPWIRALVLAGLPLLVWGTLRLRRTPERLAAFSIAWTLLFVPQIWDHTEILLFLVLPALAARWAWALAALLAAHFLLQRPGPGPARPDARRRAAAARRALPAAALSRARAARAGDHAGRARRRRARRDRCPSCPTSSSTASALDARLVGRPLDAAAARSRPFVLRTVTPPPGGRSRPARHSDRAGSASGSCSASTASSSWSST